MHLFQQSDPWQLRHIISGYVDAMLWAETDDDGDPLEINYSIGNLADETIERIRRECSEFWNLVWDIDYQRNVDTSEFTEEQCLGHDLWLDPAGHGAGFWEPGRWTIDGVEIESSDQDNPLMDASHKARGDYSTYSPYVGDDGKIYL